MPADLHVELVWSPAADEVCSRHLVLPAGATVEAALRAGGLLDAAGTMPDCGVWGRRCTAGTPLREGDRVEVYRPLQIDPMQARRLRAHARARRAPSR